MFIEAAPSESAQLLKICGVNKTMADMDLQKKELPDVYKMLRQRELGTVSGKM